MPLSDCSLRNSNNSFEIPKDRIPSNEIREEIGAAKTPKKIETPRISLLLHINTLQKKIFKDLLMSKNVRKSMHLLEFNNHDNSLTTKMQLNKVILRINSNIFKINFKDMLSLLIPDLIFKMYKGLQKNCFRKESFQVSHREDKGFKDGENVKIKKIEFLREILILNFSNHVLHLYLTLQKQRFKREVTNLREEYIRFISDCLSMNFTDGNEISRKARYKSINTPIKYGASLLLNQGCLEIQLTNISYGDIAKYNITVINSMATQNSAVNGQARTASKLTNLFSEIETWFGIFN